MIYSFTGKKGGVKFQVFYKGNSGSWDGLPCPNSCWSCQEPSAPHILGFNLGALLDVET